jgi:hypothetical protein
MATHHFLVIFPQSHPAPHSWYSQKKHRSLRSNPSAPGPSQITGHVFWQLATDPTILWCITSILNVICNGECLDANGHAFLTAGQAVIISKRGPFDAADPHTFADAFSLSSLVQELLCFSQATERTAKPRTINCGEALMKLAGVAVLGVLPDSAVPNAAGPVQLGVGAKGGTSLVAFRFQAFLDAFAHDPDMIALLVDISDAFMRASRLKMLEALFLNRDLAPTWRLFRWHISRANPRFLRMSDGELFTFLQKEGGPQGDPLMPLMFSLLMSYLLGRVLQDRPALAAAYLDDTTLGGKVSVVRQIFIDMIKLAPVECGFEINLKRRSSSRSTLHRPLRLLPLYVNSISSSTTAPRPSSAPSSALTPRACLPGCLTRCANMKHCLKS